MVFKVRLQVEGLNQTLRRVVAVRAPDYRVVLAELAAGLVDLAAGGVDGALADGAEVGRDAAPLHRLGARLLGVVGPAAADDLGGGDRRRAVGRRRHLGLRRGHGLAVAPRELARAAPVAAAAAHARVALGLRVAAPLRQAVAVAERAVQGAVRVQRPVPDLEVLVVVRPVHPPRRVPVLLVHVCALLRRVGERVPAVLPLLPSAVGVADRPRLYVSRQRDGDLASVVAFLGGLDALGLDVLRVLALIVAEC